MILNCFDYLKHFQFFLNFPVIYGLICRVHEHICQGNIGQTLLLTSVWDVHSEIRVKWRLQHLHIQVVERTWIALSALRISPCTINRRFLALNGRLKIKSINQGCY